jgi:thiol-disulfide isomerase/thioredoxin
MMTAFNKYFYWIVAAAVVLYFVGRYLYARPRFVNGEAAADFTLKKNDNTDFTLSQLRGSYVLLDFWGSWCGPCLQEAPQLRGVYAQFHGKKFKDAKSFEIVGVGIERSAERWQNAIQSLGIADWYHISDFQYLDSPVAKQYGVRVIPTKFLLNTEGVIVHVNPTSEEIHRFLNDKVVRE